MRFEKMLVAACCLPLVVAGCATTTFTSTWKAPDAKPLQFKAGEKVIALVVARQESMRRSGETNLAAVLDRAGLQGVPAYTLAIEGEAQDESKAKQSYDASGAVGVIVLRPLRQEKEISSTTYGSPYYGGFWGGGRGGGYYGHGWGGAWGGGTEIRTDTYVVIETLIYDLRQNKLVWAGQSKTMNPSDVGKFVNELAAAVSKELQAVGLIPPKK